MTEPTAPTPPRPNQDLPRPERPDGPVNLPVYPVDPDAPAGPTPTPIRDGQRFEIKFSVRHGGWVLVPTKEDAEPKTKS